MDRLKAGLFPVRISEACIVHADNADIARGNESMASNILRYIRNHLFSCLPASIPQAANISSPLEALTVATTPFEFSLS